MQTNKLPVDSFTAVPDIGPCRADRAFVGNGNDFTELEGAALLEGSVPNIPFGAGNIGKAPDIAGCFHHSASIDERLTQLAARAVDCSGADICLVLLLESEAPSALRFKLYSGHRALPPATHARWVEKAEAIARKAIADDKRPVNDDAMKFYRGARGETDDTQACMIACPIRIDGKTIGFLNVAGERDSRLFNPDSRRVLDTVSWLVVQLLRAAQLESVLSSRFAQMALAQEAKGVVANALAASNQRPEQLSKILAKAFYREMVKLGLDSAQIINAASEIICQLSENLQKHRNRNRRAGKRT